MIAVSRRWAKRPAGACVFQPGQLLAGEDRDQLLEDRRGLQSFRRVGQLVFGGQPSVELLQGPVLVAGVGAAVAVQQPGHPLLDVVAVDLLPAGLAGQVGGGEPLHGLGIGAYRLGGLVPGGQVQSERADLGLEHPGVQLLGLAGARSRCGHGLLPFLPGSAPSAARRFARAGPKHQSGRAASLGYEGQGSLASSRSLAVPDLAAPLHGESCPARR